MPTNFLVDSCVLIEYFRARDKSATWYYRLIQEHWIASLSVVVIFEVFSGANGNQREFWKEFLHGAVRLPFDERTAEIAADIFRELWQKNVRMEFSDLFIAATAIANDLPLATLNRKHFEQVDGLRLLVPVKLNEIPDDQ